MPTKKPNETTVDTPGPLTNESETWTQVLSILSAMRLVTNELREEADAILKANPHTMMRPGFSERVDLVTTLSDAYRDLSTDVRNTARSSGLAMSEDIR